MARVSAPEIERTGRRGHAKAEALSTPSVEADHVALPMRPRRDRRLLLIGVLATVLGTLGITWVWSQSNTTADVVVVTRSVARGEVIRASDLGTTSIAGGAGIPRIAADESSAVIGKTALVDLPVGTMVAPQAIGEPVVDAGTAHVGLRLAPGRIPAQHVPVGARVSLVSVAGPNATGAVPSSVQYSATVVTAPQELADGQTWIVDVAVPADVAADVARLAATDGLAVVRQADHK